MDRQESVEETAAGDSLIEQLPPNPFANKTLPDVARTTAGLEPYAGPWGTEQRVHLLRRTLFGTSHADLDAVSSMTMDEIVNALLAQPPDESSQPLNTDARDLVPVGETWVNAAFNDPNSTFTPTGIRRTSLKAWWTGLMINQTLSLREKMVLFWHNHFVTETVDVGDPRLSYRYVALIRSNALGNFRQLTKLVSLDMAMLKYLNGSTSTKANPNENYARELQELFTIGKGPEVAPGDYTHYTEADVQAAARVLTGYRNDTTNLVSYFDPTRHDTTDKQFSADYGNVVIPGRTGADGASELDDLLSMIFAQEETALFLCRKLYRWFIYYVIDATTEANVIVPMADILRKSHYDIVPALQALFRSAHFYDPVNIGCMIKNPVEHVVSTFRHLGIPVPDADVVIQYKMWDYLRGQASTMGMDLGDPPNVAGWPAYYQIPTFYETWINSDSLPKRNSFTNRMATSGYSTSGYKLVSDPVAFAGTVSNPGDPNVIVNEWASFLFPFALTQTQKDFLNDTLLPGLPDYEWTVEWNAYINDPTNTQKLSAVRTKLQSLLAFMLNMPEFHLT